MIKLRMNQIKDQSMFTSQFTESHHISSAILYR